MRPLQTSSLRAAVLATFVIVTFAGCADTLERSTEGYGHPRHTQTVAGANANPLVHSMPSFDVIQYVETDDTSGPTLHYVPESISLPQPEVSGSQKWRGLMSIANTGYANLTRSEVSIVGRDSAKFRLVSRHAPKNILRPGQFEDFEVEYLPRRCRTLFNPLAVDEAELRIVSDAGVVVLPLTGDRWGCAQWSETQRGIRNEHETSS